MHVGSLRGLGRRIQAQSSLNFQSPISNFETGVVALKSRIGFTLVELLVVVAIMAMLAAVLFPVFSDAISSSKGLGCKSNLAQLGKAYQMYVDDWQASCCAPGNFCPWGKLTKQHTLPWAQALYAYHHSLEIYKCPARKVNFAYSINESLSLGTPVRPTITLLMFECPGSGNFQDQIQADGTDVQSPTGTGNAQACNVGQYDPTTGSYNVYNGAADIDSQSSIDSISWCPTSPNATPSISSTGVRNHPSWLFFPGPHDGMTNILFVDGHVQAFDDWLPGRMTFDPRKRF